jgi:acyl-[acyl-carrier-protein]-phospholipid O-acyltransferase / long-chain-fatty-acid--[acyl-carrier-protein] ligase
MQILFKIFLWFATHIFYRVRLYGAENIPHKGGALLICNQKSYLDFLFVIASTKRNVRFFVHRPLYEKPLLRFIFARTLAIPISLDDATEVRAQGLKEAHDALAAGHVVCLFLGLGLHRSPSMLHFNEGFDYLREELDVPIIPMYIDQMWGSVFLYDKGEYFQRFPKKMPYPVNILIGGPLPSKSAGHLVRTAVQELSTTTFSLRRKETRTLHEAFVAEAKKHAGRLCMVDSSVGGITYGKALAAVLKVTHAIKHLITKQVNAGEHIGVLLPQSCLAAVTNIAVLLSGNIPVNMSSSMPRERREAIIHECRIKTVISSEEYLSTHTIARSEGMVLVDNALIFRQTLSTAFSNFLMRFCPLSLFNKLWHLPQGQSLDSLATVVFSSGSTGEPKGIMLSHLNILSNIEGLYQMLRLSHKDVLLGTLPFEHPFGLTATLFFPLVTGMAAVYEQDEKNTDDVSAIVKERAVTVLVAHPAALERYARKCPAEAFDSLRYAIVGVDKLSKHITAAFHSAFGLMPFESYGATELSPIVSLGMPAYALELVVPDGAVAENSSETARQAFKVGYPLPGIAVKIVVPDTNEQRAYNEKGLLLVKGPNVMMGYLGDEARTKEAMQDGWFITGDIAFIDNNGFLHVIDRLSRFTQVGDEEVSHALLEEELMDCVGSSELLFSVTAVSDDKDQERLVVLYDRSVNIKKLLREMSLRSLPQGWLPDEEFFYEVPMIPHLPSGKADLVRVKDLAQERHFVHHAAKDVVEVEIMTEDNVQIWLNHYKRGNTKVIILAHGWRNSKDNYLFKLISGMFTKMYDVICFDFRGNGKSGGLFSWVSDEHLDLRATIDYALRCGYQRIGVVGFSLGAASTIIECSKNRNVNSVIVISAPLDFWKIDYHFWEEDIAKDLKIIFGPKGYGRTLRSGNPFHAKIRPIDVVHKISPTPLHFIHGDADWLIKPYHSKELYLNAAEPKKLTMLTGEGHADRIYDSNPQLFEKICFEWFAETL